MRTRRPLRPVVGREISRFPGKRLPHMPGSTTPPGRPWARAGAHGRVAFRSLDTVGTRDKLITGLNGWPVRSPAHASSAASRPRTHGLGPMRIATPSSQWTCTIYLSPVSRRTQSRAEGYADKFTFSRDAYELQGKIEQV